MTDTSTIILPLAGKSTRFPAMRLKWTLTAPDGDLMLKKALDSIEPENHRVVLGILREHEEAYGLIKGVQRALGDRDIEIIVLEQETSGPADTVFQIIQRANIRGPIVIKDSDSWFSPLLANGHNFIAVADLRSSNDVARVASKSFVVVNDQMLATNVIEKSVVSNYVCVGGYSFREANLFSSCFERARKETASEIFVSHVIVQALELKEAFAAVVVNSYVDVGTSTEWTKYRNDQSSYFVDIDGIIVEGREEYFGRLWIEGDKHLERNVQALLKLQQKGAQFIFLSSRPGKYKPEVEGLLNKVGLRSHEIIMGCRNAKRYLVNNFTGTNPFPSAIAINLPQDEDTLGAYI